MTQERKKERREARVCNNRFLDLDILNPGLDYPIRKLGRCLETLHHQGAPSRWCQKRVQCFKFRR